jgi:hypothetical protein
MIAVGELPFSIIGLASIDVIGVIVGLVVVTLVLDIGFISSC